MNWIIPRFIAADPDRMGSQVPSRMYQLTGIDVEPNVTEHRAKPIAGTAGLLYGFILTEVGIIS